MSVAITFLAAIAGIVIWWLSQQQLTSKPWLEVGLIAEKPKSAAPPAMIGLGVFLAVAACLFALLFSAYFMRMEVATVNTEEWRPLPTFKLLWVNTGVLLLSSGALQWANVAAQRKRMHRVKACLFAGGILSLAFLGGQLWVWRQLTEGGFFLTTNPANSFFFLITGVHGIHVIGGLLALSRSSISVWRGLAPDLVGLSVSLCAFYWHFVLLVWLFFFAMLVKV